MTNKFTSALREIVRASGSLAAGHLPDALMVAGMSSASYGAWLVYQPAGFIVAGLFLLVGGVILSRGPT